MNASQNTQDKNSTSAGHANCAVNDCFGHELGTKVYSFVFDKGTRQERTQDVKPMMVEGAKTQVAFPQGAFLGVQWVPTRELMVKDKV